MSSDTKVRLACLGVVLAGVAGSTALTPMIAASEGRHSLAYTDRAEQDDPPQVALGIAMGAFRGLFVNYLWIRANTLKEQGKHFEAIELARAITTLQPRFPRVWVFHAWNLSYNISVTTQTPEERWQWVNAGIRIIRDEGLAANPNDQLLHKELGWIFLHKIGGYTDDSNQYYKRELAAEWEQNLGAPPRPDPADRSRERRIEQFAQWLQPIVDAPTSLRELERTIPRAGDIARALEARLAEPVGRETLRREALCLALERSGRLEQSVPAFGPKNAAFYAIRSDPANRDAWPAFIAHVRKRVLVDEYNMEPVRMLRLTRRFGPIDWRAPAAHGLYWAARGVDVGHMEVDTDNSESFDFVNTYRIMAQSIQDLWRYGDIYFNYLDVAQGRPAYMMNMPNPDMLEAYGEILTETFQNAGIFESWQNPYNMYAAGYENFMVDAVMFFYRRGDTANAERWYERLRTWEGLNINNRQWRADELSLPLDDFVAKNLFDRSDSPNVAVQEFTGAMQGAIFAGLLQNDDQTFWGMWRYAQRAHAFYIEKQYRQVLAGGDNARTEFLDRDFAFLAGNTFARLITTLPPDEAEILYFNAGRIAGPSLQRYAYDALRELYLPVIEEANRQNPGSARPFEEVFIEPDGMAAFRVDYNAKLEARRAANVEGLEQK